MIQNLLIILNLVLLEGLLSVDNAAVLAVMVKHLPDAQQNKALRWGMWGAYVLRGTCLLIASYLMKVLWLKIAGGCYLLYLTYGHFTPQNDTIEEQSKPEDSKIIRFAGKIGLSQLWATIVLVEVMDLAFSIDNVFAAVAMSNTYWVVLVGVCIGITAMRLVAGWFLMVMKKYPSLETSAFIVIGLLGLKLMIAGFSHYIASLHKVDELMSEHSFDLFFSLGMMIIFFFPLLRAKKRA